MNILNYTGKTQWVRGSLGLVHMESVGRAYVDLMLEPHMSSPTGLKVLKAHRVIQFLPDPIPGYYFLVHEEVYLAAKTAGREDVVMLRDGKLIL